MSMSEDTLKAIEARLEAATPGPWSWSNMRESAQGGHVPAAVRWVRQEPRGRTTTFIASCDSANIDNDTNATFIAHSREDIPALLADVRELRALAGELAEALDDHEGDCVGCKNRELIARAAGVLA